MTSARYPFVAFLALCAFLASAQVHMGLRGGLAFSNVAFKQVDGLALAVEDLSTKPRIGLTGSLVADIPLSNRVSLLPELGYLQRGFRQEIPYTGLGTPGTVNTELDYVESAILSRFHIGHGKVQPHFLAGGTFGYLLDFSQYSQSAQQGNGSLMITDQDRWNIGLCGGAGLAIKVGTGMVFLDARYDYGLTGMGNALPFAGANGSVIRGGMPSFDRTWQYSLSWLIPLGNRQKAKAEPVAPPNGQWAPPSI
jgi:hypothetical protein